MNSKAILMFGIFMFVFLFAAQAQLLERIPISDSERIAGIDRRYMNVNTYDGFTELVLYKNNIYQYRIESTNYSRFSTGNWKIKQKRLYLTSILMHNNIPVKVDVQDGIDPQIRKTIFAIPLDLLGNDYPDSKIYLNSYKSFCFPFFDTCVAVPSKTHRIKVDFGNGFRSGWIRKKPDSKNRITLVAQTEENLNQYLVFKKRQYRFVDQGLELLKEK